MPLVMRLCRGPRCADAAHPDGQDYPAKYFPQGSEFCDKCTEQLQNLQQHGTTNEPLIACRGRSCRGKMLPISKFGNNPRNTKRHGKKSYCKKCESRVVSDWYRSHPNADLRRKQYAAQYWVENKKAIQARRFEREAGLPAKKPQNSYPYVNSSVVER